MKTTLKHIWRRVDRFCLGMAVSVDNLTVGICRVSGQPIPVGVIRRRRKWAALETLV